MAIKKKKISDFPLLEQSLRGFFTIGYQESRDGDQTTAQSYKADLGFVEDAAQEARTATEEARAASGRADEAAVSAGGAAQSARAAASAAGAATENADRQAAYASAQGDYAREQGLTIDSKIGGKLDRAQVGEPSGAASLDGDGNVPLAQLGSLASVVQPAPELGDNDRLLMAGQPGENPVQSVTTRQLAASIPYVGKNIVPCTPAGWEQGFLNLDGSLGSSPGYLRTTDYWPAAPGQYIASMSDNWVHSLILAYDSNKTCLSGMMIKSTTWINQVIELPAGTAYVKLSGRKDPLGTATPNDMLGVRIKIERGSVATPWCPNPYDIQLQPDYTSLTEQIVPGEFWLDVDGVKRQVYIRSFAGTTPSEFIPYGTSLNLPLPYCWEWAFGFGMRYTNLVVGEIAEAKNMSNAGLNWVIRYDGVWFREPTYFINKPYFLTVKYTKKSLCLKSENYLGKK